MIGGEKRTAKQDVRARALEARDAIPADARAEKSRLVCEQFEGLLAEVAAKAAPRRAVVAVYAAMRSEVDLSAFVEAAYAAGATVAFPCMNAKEEESGEGRKENGANESSPKGDESPERKGAGRMCMRRVSEGQWRSGRAPFIAKPIARFALDAPEISAYPLVEPESIDLIAVPLTAFDADNRRLGYGGGNYDEYLPKLRAGAAIAGAAFAEQRVGRVPTEPHDRPLERIFFA